MLTLAAHIRTWEQHREDLHGLVVNANSQSVPLKIKKEKEKHLIVSQLCINFKADSSFEVIWNVSNWKYNI